MDHRASLPPRALSARYYTAPEVYARARDRLFHASWQFACHASRVPEAGDYLAFTVMDQDLFVIRGRDGVARCFYNVCQHRGHVLLEGSGRTHLVAQQRRHGFGQQSPHGVGQDGAIESGRPGAPLQQAGLPVEQRESASARPVHANGAVTLPLFNQLQRPPGTVVPRS